MQLIVVGLIIVANRIYIILKMKSLLNGKQIYQAI